ncbi:hypothetical protein E2C01_083527 [Portunus trituberculatus]|uniref:Uncharacterized protein n=1 Tax=Portunus trituberculatus TaxID=210409 RepID=A0A5B7IXE9_PORTR|nr:hypothetical protein [Portunus trituberculatus]
MVNKQLIPHRNSSRPALPPRQRRFAVGVKESSKPAVLGQDALTVRNAFMAGVCPCLPGPLWETRASLPALSPAFRIVALQPLLKPPPQENY